MTHRLHIDLETRSAIDLRQTGVYPYAKDKTTDVWCASFAVDDGPVKRWRPGEPVQEEIICAVHSDYLLIAHNAQFERILWKYVLTARYGWPEPEMEQWRCTMSMALAMALPGGLEHLSPALGLDIRKDMKGNALMKQMMRPRNPKKDETAQPDENGLLWWDDAERRARLEAYCDQDVETERTCETRLFQLSDAEQQLWFLDQQINDRGIGVDPELANAALKIVGEHTAKLNAELREITGGAVSAGTNVAQIVAWLRSNGVETESLDKEAVNFLLTRELPPPAHRALEIRREVSKASVRKINKLLQGTDEDGRARGLLQFHAASTGRWGGRRFQPHNLKRPELKNVEAAIRLVSLGDADAVEIAYGNPLSVVGDCLRAMVRAAPGNTLLASDFSNIEGRGLAWLAGEDWKLDAFRAYDAGTGPDLYKLAYARAFHISVDEIADNDPRRQIGKTMELALGYEGGVGAFQTMASAFNVTVSDAEAEELKTNWRAAHPATKQLWRDLIDSAVRAVGSPGRRVTVQEKLTFLRKGSFLLMRLPSGRVLTYPYPRLAPMVWVEDRATGKRRPLPLEQAEKTPGIDFDRENANNTVVYKGVYGKTLGDVYLYGGMLAENATQALSRDVLVEAMSRVESAGYPIVLHVHDEIVAEVRKGYGDFEEFNALMQEIPTWAEGFPIVAAGWTGERYRK